MLRHPGSLPKQSFSFGLQVHQLQPSGREGRRVAGGLGAAALHGMFIRAAHIPFVLTDQVGNDHFGGACVAQAGQKDWVLACSGNNFAVWEALL